jgi:hypothetical protein
MSHFNIFGSCAWIHTPHERNNTSHVDCPFYRMLVGCNGNFQGYHIYDPTSHQVIKDCDAIFDEPLLHGFLRYLPSLLYCYGSLHVSMDHASSPLARSLVDDFELVTMDLSLYPYDIVPPIGTPLSTSSTIVEQFFVTLSSSGPSSIPNVSSSPLSSYELLPP